MIFGSRAKGTFKNGSDIDLAVFAPTLSEQNFIRLWNELDALPRVLLTLLNDSMSKCDHLAHLLFGKRPALP
ncbi:MAG: nucleotidyltransferase domain-containing protein [Burkholderiales bacterium]|nr:nucleotidyltransferase domain-containing protein [Burkholderiales bacterium]